MMGKWRLAVTRLAMGFLALLLGCSAPRSVSYEERAVSTEEIHSAVEENHRRVHAVLGSGRISLESPELAQSGSFELVLRKPDSVLVRLEGPFGLDVGSALVTREEFLFYSSLQNQLITGPTNSQNLNRILRLNLGFDDVLNLFTGGIFLPEDRTAPDEFAVDGDELRLQYLHPTGTRTYWVDPGSLLIVRVQLLDAQGRLILEQRFSKFTTIDGITIPQYVRLTMHRERRMFAISFSDLSVNTPHVQFTLHIPPNASRVRWQ